MKDTVNALKRALKSASTALVAAHVDPDGDSLGSMLAMGLLLEDLGIRVTCFSQDGVPKIYRFLPGADKIVNKLPNGTRYDLLIGLDSSDMKRLGEKFSPAKVAKVIVNIDHHPDNTRYGDINYVTNCSSTAELVYHLARALKWKIDLGVAENLYVALITDTGNYRYENTSAATFAMAEELIKTGVNTHAITTRIYDNRSMASVIIQAEALAKMETSADRKAAWATVTEEMMERLRARSDDLVGLVDHIRSIEGVEVAILFRQDKDKVKINFRSKDKVNVSEIAKRFGGGGHIRAAGAIVKGEIGRVKDKVVCEVEKYLIASRYLV